MRNESCGKGYEREEQCHQTKIFAPHGCRFCWFRKDYWKTKFCRELKRLRVSGRKASIFRKEEKEFLQLLKSVASQNGEEPLESGDCKQLFHGRRNVKLET